MMGQLKRPKKSPLKAWRGKIWDG